MEQNKMKIAIKIFTALILFMSFINISANAQTANQKICEDYIKNHPGFKSCIYPNNKDKNPPEGGNTCNKKILLENSVPEKETNEEKYKWPLLYAIENNIRIPCCCQQEIKECQPLPQIHTKYKPKPGQQPKQLVETCGGAEQCELKTCAELNTTCKLNQARAKCECMPENK